MRSAFSSLASSFSGLNRLPKGSQPETRLPAERAAPPPTGPGTKKLPESNDILQILDEFNKFQGEREARQQRVAEKHRKRSFLGHTHGRWAAALGGLLLAGTCIYFLGVWRQSIVDRTGANAGRADFQKPFDGDEIQAEGDGGTEPAGGNGRQMGKLAWAKNLLNNILKRSAFNSASQKPRQSGKGEIGVFEGLREVAARKVVRVATKDPPPATAGPHPAPTDRDGAHEAAAEPLPKGPDEVAETKPKTASPEPLAKAARSGTPPPPLALADWQALRKCRAGSRWSKFPTAGFRDLQSASVLVKGANLYVYTRYVAVKKPLPGGPPKDKIQSFMQVFTAKRDRPDLLLRFPLEPSQGKSPKGYFYLAVLKPDHLRDWPGYVAGAPQSDAEALYQLAAAKGLAPSGLPASKSARQANAYAALGDEAELWRSDNVLGIERGAIKLYVKEIEAEIHQFAASAPASPATAEPAYSWFDAADKRTLAACTTAASAMQNRILTQGLERQIGLQSSSQPP